jgi:GTP 3',8-cyclase
MGHLYQSGDRYLFTQADILKLISQKYSIQALPRKLSSTANYWQTGDGSVFGIIANHSHPFCADCNRLRLDQKGNIYGCLSSNQPISLVNIKDEGEMEEQLRKALAQKQQWQFTGSDLSMLAIGG